MYLHKIYIFREEKSLLKFCFFFNFKDFLCLHKKNRKDINFEL